VLVGGLIGAGLLAFSLVPTKDLRLKPTQPLYFYLVALMRVQVGACHMAEQGMEGH
jgi:A/G-specific adenine glycosylase